MDTDPQDLSAAFYDHNDVLYLDHLSDVYQVCDPCLFNWTNANKD